jgi:hypothetical protein
MVGGIASKMPAVALGAGVVAGGAMLTDALSQQYEKVMEPVMDLTAALGGLSESARENSLTFRQNLKDAADEAGKFGYAIDKAIPTIRAFAEQGADIDADSAYAYARGFGISDPSSLAQAQARSGRFGAGNALGIAAGGLEMSGMSPGQYSEYLNSMQSIFEEGISRGVIRGFGDISGMMNFLSGAGPQFEGEGAARVLGTMNQAAANAIHMSRESDVLLYRAFAEGGGTGLDIAKAMESGFAGDRGAQAFQSLIQQITSLTSGDQEMSARILAETLGLSLTESDAIYQMAKGGDFSAARSMIVDAEKADSKEMEMLNSQQQIIQTIREVGTGATDLKTGLLRGLAGTVEGISRFLGVDFGAQEDRVRTEIAIEENRGPANEIANSILRQVSSMARIGAEGSSLGEGFMEGFTSKMNTVAGNWRNPEEMRQARELEQLLGSMSDSEVLGFVNQGGLTGLQSGNSVSDMVNSARSAITRMRTQQTPRVSEALSRKDFESGSAMQIAVAAGADPIAERREWQAYQNWTSAAQRRNPGVLEEFGNLGTDDLMELFRARAFSSSVGDADKGGLFGSRSDRHIDEAEVLKVWQDITNILVQIRDNPGTLEMDSPPMAPVRSGTGGSVR